MVSASVKAGLLSGGQAQALLVGGEPQSEAVDLSLDLDECPALQAVS